VIRAAVHLLAERPEASMRDIADASGLGRTTVYRHFPRRQDLVEAIYLEVLAEARAAVDAALAQGGPALEVLRGLGPRLVAIGDRYRFLDTHPELRERALAGEGEADDPLPGFLRRAQAGGEVRDDLPVAWMIAALRGLAVVAMVEVGAGRVTADEAGRHVGETFAAAVAPR
jgi:AcrR family transcriptional regulator